MSDGPGKPNGPSAGLQFCCPSCGEWLSMRAEAAGKDGPCPFCYVHIIAPDPAARQGAKIYIQYVPVTQVESNFDPAPAIQNTSPQKKHRILPDTRKSFHATRRIVAAGEDPGQRQVPPSGPQQQPGPPQQQPAAPQDPQNSAAAPPAGDPSAPVQGNQPRSSTSHLPPQGSGPQPTEGADTEGAENGQQGGKWGKLFAGLKSD